MRIIITSIKEFKTLKFDNDTEYKFLFTCSKADRAEKDEYYPVQNDRYSDTQKIRPRTISLPPGTVSVKTTPECGYYFYYPSSFGRCDKIRKIKVNNLYFEIMGPLWGSLSPTVEKLKIRNRYLYNETVDERTPFFLDPQNLRKLRLPYSDAFTFGSTSEEMIDKLVNMFKQYPSTSSGCFGVKYKTMLGGWTVPRGSWFYGRYNCKYNAYKIGDKRAVDIKYYGIDHLCYRSIKDGEDVIPPLQFDHGFIKLVADIALTDDFADRVKISYIKHLMGSLDIEPQIGYVPSLDGYLIPKMLEKYSADEHSELFGLLEDICVHFHLPEHNLANVYAKYGIMSRLSGNLYGMFKHEDVDFIDPTCEYSLLYYLVEKDEITYLRTLQERFEMNYYRHHDGFYFIPVDEHKMVEEMVESKSEEMKTVFGKFKFKIIERSEAYIMTSMLKEAIDTVLGY